MARTYVHLGAVYITGSRTATRRSRASRARSEIDPAIQLSKGIATPEVNDAFNEAKRTGRRQRPAAAVNRRPRPRSGGAADHGRRAEARRPAGAEAAPSASQDDDGREPDLPVRDPGARLPRRLTRQSSRRPVTLRCALAPRFPVAKVLLDYREPGDEEYVEVADDEVAQGLVPGQDPEEGGDRQVAVVLLRGQERGRQGRRRKRRSRTARTSCCSWRKSPTASTWQKKKGGSSGRGRRGRGEPARGAGGPRTRRSSARPDRQGRGRPGRPLRQAQVVDRDRRGQRLRLREGQRAGGGEHVARPAIPRPGERLRGRRRVGGPRPPGARGRRSSVAQSRRSQCTGGFNTSRSRRSSRATGEGRDTR